MDENKILKYIKNNFGENITSIELENVKTDVVNDIWSNKILFTKDVNIDYVAGIVVRHVLLFRRVEML